MSHLERLRALVQPGFIGTYSHCELTEIIAIPPGSSKPQNVYSLAAIEDQRKEHKPKRLTSALLQIPALKGWKFGVYQTVLSLDKFETALGALEQSGQWSPTGEPLGIGALRQADPRYVPSDSSQAIPLNKVLKNNFWGGSHLLEWADPAKTIFSPFFKAPPLLETLTAKIKPFVPIDLASMSDRLGNIVIQVPVTALMVKCQAPRDGSEFQVSVQWRPGAAPRMLLASISAEDDSTVSGFATAKLERDSVALPIPAGARDPKVYVADANTGVLVGGTGVLRWFNQISIDMRAVSRRGAEPRTFGYQDRKGQLRAVRVHMQEKGIRHPLLIGEPAPTDPNGGFTQNRLYLYDADQVRTDRIFRQYGITKESKVAGHQRALEDIYFLMGKHGEEGVYLWDPYLDAVDLLETLFHCPHSGADLRALGGSDAAKRAKTPITAFMQNQAAALNNVSGNVLGLRLSYRIPYRLQDAAFHDRFLVFPKIDGPDLAWSLGTSVNSLGHAHHILQRVDEGQRVSDAFQALWNRMKAPQIVWEKK